MPQFAYTARTAEGRDVDGTVAADSRGDVLALLTERALFPLTVEVFRDRRPGLALRRRVKAEVVAATLSQLSDLIANGVPLLKSLEILAAQSPHEQLRDVLDDVRGRVADGQQLDEAIAAHPRVFNELTRSIIRAGTEGAFLEDALKQTAAFLEHQEEIRARIRSAMAYPAFLAAAGTVVTLVLIVFFVPKFAELFGQLEKDGLLPLPTVALLWLSSFLGRYGILAGFAAAGCVMGIRRWMSSANGRVIVDRTKIRVPLFGPVFLNAAVSRFCRVLGTLLQNGVPLLKALHVSSDSAGNVILSRAIRDSSENVSSGETLAAPLAACGLMPPNIMAMIAIAEESNNLEQVLTNVADQVDRRIARQLDTMVRLVEPALLLVMGSAVLFVITALLLPVFEMSTSMA